MRIGIPTLINSVCLFLSMVTHTCRYGIPLVLVLLVVVNLFIFLFPRSNQQTSASREDVDSLFIVRIFLLLLVTASIIISFVLVGVFHWAEPIRARVLHNKQQQQ